MSCLSTEIEENGCGPGWYDMLSTNAHSWLFSGMNGSSPSNNTLEFALAHFTINIKNVHKLKSVMHTLYTNNSDTP